MKKNVNILKYMPAFTFCIMIFLIPILYILISDSEFSPLEKRKLSQLPEITVERVFNGKFGKDFETYLNDQMPLRTFFVGTNAYFDQLSGRNGLNGIYNAKDDYLMVIPVKEISTLDNNIKYIGEFIDDMKKSSYVCIVPTSGFIYNDKLPSNHYEYRDDEIIGKIENSFTGISNVSFINLIDNYRSMAESKQLYYKTDHHWTSQGAYECYKILGEKMKFSPTSEENFTIEKYDGFHGTNYSKSALWLTPSEPLEIWVNREQQPSSVSVSISEGNGEFIMSDSLFFRENLNTQDQYTAFLDGNHDKVIITNKNAETDKKLLILRDSYSHCLAPFLADNYSKIVLIDMRYFRTPVSDIVEKEQIDDILFLYSLDSIVTSTDIAALF